MKKGKSLKKKKGGSVNNIHWKFLSEYFNNHDAFKGVKSKFNETINFHKLSIEQIFKNNQPLIIDILIYFNLNKEQQKLHDISQIPFIKETINKTLLYLVINEDIDLPESIINSRLNDEVFNIKGILEKIIYNTDSGIHEIFFDHCLYGSLPKIIKNEINKLWIKYASKNRIDAFFDLEPYKNEDDLPIWIYYRVSIWENIFRGNEKHSIHGFLGTSGNGYYNFCGPGTKIIIRTQEPFWHFYLLLTNILEHNVNGRYPWNKGVSTLDNCCKDHDLNYVSASWEQEPQGLLFDDEMEYCIKKGKNNALALASASASASESASILASAPTSISAPRTLISGLATAKRLGLKNETFTDYDPVLTSSFRTNRLNRKSRAEKKYKTRKNNNTMNPLINMGNLSIKRPGISNSYEFQPSNITQNTIRKRQTHKGYLNHLKQRNNNNAWGTYCPDKRYYCRKGTTKMKNWCVKKKTDCDYNGILTPGMRKKCKSYIPGKSGEPCDGEDDEQSPIYSPTVTPPIPYELQHALEDVRPNTV